MSNRSRSVNSILLLIIFIAAWIAYPYLKNEIAFLKHHEEHEDHDDGKKGPHHGRLLEKDGFQVEVTIYEPEGIPPRFRIYFYDHGIPVKPSEVKYQMQLTRINGVEQIPFKEMDGFLESVVEAHEPHSFKVNIHAEFKGKSDEWEYETYEGRVELNPETIQANSIKIETARQQVLEIQLNVMGKIMPNQEATVYISPRFPGVVKDVYKKLGDIVHKGETLATIESNESLRNYEVKSEIDGMVIKKEINIGMYLSGQENIFVISDLSTVWADFNLYRRDLAQVKKGNPVIVKSLDGNLKENAIISYLSPLGYENTQSIIARAILANHGDKWKPGLFITGEITVDSISVPVAVKDSALQTFRDWDVVFLAVGNTFEVVPVKLGRRNQEWVEVISGLSPGDRYVAENSFILKADLEKNAATHEH